MASDRISHRWLVSRLCTAASVALLATGIAACGGENATSASGGGSPGAGQGSSSGAGAATTMMISRQNDPTSFDPAQEVTTGGGLETLTAFYERLIDVDEKGKLQPALATSWKGSADGKTYTLKLRKGVKFHDGSTFDAEQVRYTWKRIVAMKSPAAQYWQNVRDVVVDDPDTVTFKLKTPSPAFLSTLASARGVYMGPSKECVEAHEKKPGDWAKSYFADHECGTGPYVLDSWEHDQQITFEASPDYWAGWDGDHVKRYVQKIIKEPSTAQLLLKQGGLDLAADVLPTQIYEQLKDDPNVTVDMAPTATIDIFTFNMDKKPTSDPRVRRAISMLFDYDAAIEQAYRGSAQRVYGPLPSTVWPPMPDGAVRYNRDVEGAKKLLAEAGYADGFTLKLATDDLNEAKNLALILQSSLADANIKVDVDITTWPVLFTKLSKPRGEKPFDMAGYQMSAAVPDPSDILMWWNTDAITVINPGWGTPETDKMIEAAGSDTDPDARATKYQAVMKQLASDAPAIWVDQPQNPTAMRKNVEGYTYNPFYTGMIDFYALSKSS